VLEVIASTHSEDLHRGKYSEQRRYKSQDKRRCGHCVAETDDEMRLRVCTREQCRGAGGQHGCKKTFLRFLFWSRFLTFLTFFLFPKRFLFKNKTLAKFRLTKQINKKHFQNNSNEIDL